MTKPELSTGSKTGGQAGSVGSELTTTEVITHPQAKDGIKFHKEPSLLERASQLNKLSEVSQVALGMCLVAIKEQKAYEPQYSSFDEYYKNELSRTKGDISKLLTVGRFMLDGGFPEETEVGYTKLYTAYSVFPDKDPQYVLAAAQSNTISEMLANRRDEAFPNCKHPEWEVFHYKQCPTCKERHNL